MILARTVSGADTRRAEGQRAGRVQRATDDQVVGMLGDRQALAGDHALVDARSAVDDDSIDRDRLAGSHPHVSPTRTSAIGDIDLDAVAEDAGRARSEVDQAADGIGGMGPRPSLEVPAEQDQRDDRRRRVEVERQRLVVHAEAGGAEERRERRSSRPSRSRRPTCRRR